MDFPPDSLMRVYRIFIGSPGDVEHERNIVSEVIGTLNRTIGSVLDIRIEEFRWEEHAIPEFGAHAQEIIEAQAIAENKVDCGIFLLWHRFGTPVGETKSGWESEFRKLVEQHTKDKTTRIMFFVKNNNVHPRKINADQLDKVNKFLLTMNGLYTTFSSDDELEEKLQRSITDIIRRFEKISKKRRKVI